MKGDVADQAQDQIEAFNNQSVDRARKAALPENHPEFDGTHCIACDVDIPAARLALGKVRCIDCQTLLEKRK